MLQDPNERTSSEDSEHCLFQSLLRELVSGDVSPSTTTQSRHMQFPAQVDTSRLRTIIRREFRSQDSPFDVTTRKSVAFRALRELTKKLVYALQLESVADAAATTTTTTRLRPVRHAQQAARHVAPLLSLPAPTYLRPGLFLLAHPNMTGYFRRSVICILDHNVEEPDEPDEENDATSSSYGTYGLIVNRSSVSSKTGKTLTLGEVLRPLPAEITQTFGASPVREGGPVHMALQMLYRETSVQQQETKIGGTVLSPLSVQPPDETTTTSTALETDQAVFFRGDVVRAAQAVQSDTLDRDDVSFFVGASCWSAGQLERELALGFWLPCSGPTAIAQSGICDHDPTPNGQPRPETDLWLSMMSSCGEEEAKLAHLLFRDEGRDSNGAACDEY
jgi:putative AlgH/UPF0301 family transcriptional regulator